MGCSDCERFQDGDKTSYIRWGTANVEIRACTKHLREVFEVLRMAQRGCGGDKPCENCPVNWEGVCTDRVK